MKKFVMLLAVVAVLALSTGSVLAGPGEPGTGGDDRPFSEKPVA